MNLLEAKNIINNKYKVRYKSEMYILDEFDKNYIYIAYNKKQNSYEIPGGGAKKSESPIDTAIRETLEEIGVECKNIRLLKSPIKIDLDDINYKKNKYDFLIVYSFASTFDKINNKLYGDGPEGKLKLKRMHIDDVILYFKNMDSKINLYTKNTLTCLNLIKNQ